MQLTSSVLHEQANPLLGKFCLPGTSYDQDKSEDVRNKKWSACAMQGRLILALTFHLFGSIDTKQRFGVLLARFYQGYWCDHLPSLLKQMLKILRNIFKIS